MLLSVHLVDWESLSDAGGCCDFRPLHPDSYSSYLPRRLLAPSPRCGPWPTSVCGLLPVITSAAPPLLVFTTCSAVGLPWLSKTTVLAPPRYANMIPASSASITVACRRRDSPRPWCFCRYHHPTVWSFCLTNATGSAAGHPYYSAMLFSLHDRLPTQR